jgi:hypothetical protein
MQSVNNICEVVYHIRGKSKSCVKLGFIWLKFGTAQYCLSALRHLPIVAKSAWTDFPEI